MSDDEQQPRQVPGRRLPRPYLGMLLLGLAVLVIDQGSKLWATRTLDDGHHITVIPNFLELRLLYNPGAAFSFGSGSTWVFTIAAGGAVLGLLYYGRRVHSPAWAVVTGMMLGGATSHLLDRLFRAPAFGQGHVVDFIGYSDWFVGNVADIALTVGAALMLLLSLRGVPFAHQPAPPGEPAPGTRPEGGQQDEDDEQPAGHGQ